MRFYTKNHKHYCRIDLHAKKMFLCILDAGGEVLLHRNIASAPDAFLKAVQPFREDLVVGVECMLAWYWLADLCRKEKIEFVLGHALYMKVVHGGKAKNDKIDSHKIAVLLRGGSFPMADVYPPEMRATRDLLRIPAETGHHSGGKASTVPTPIRPPFRWETGHHSGAIRSVSESVGTG